MDAVVLFGCAVRADGRPSPALARRIALGVRAAAAGEGPILCSGAAGPVGPSEASVMARELVAAGVDSRRLVLDETSRDTLQSVIATLRLVRSRGLAGCVVCSEGYHIPRIRLMLALLGVRSAPGPRAAGRGGAGLHRLRMGLREAFAIPYDLAIVLVRRRALLADR